MTRPLPELTLQNEFFWTAGGDGVLLEARGLERYAADEERPLEECFQTLVTGLAVRYFKAVAG